MIRLPARKNGTPVATPVWHAVDGTRLVVWTDPASGKAKRLRHTDHVTVAASDSRGKVAETSSRYPATARILDPADSQAARKLLARRYLIVRLTDLLARLLPCTARPGIALAITFPT